MASLSELSVLVLLITVGLWVVADARHHKKRTPNLCPFPCVCQNHEVYCDGTAMFHLPLRIPKDTTFLNAKNNYIQRIRSIQTHGLKKLHTLSLRNNHINFIDQDTFSGLRQLRSLTLRDNFLRELAPDTLKGLYNLEQLSFRNNQLQSIEGLLKGLRSLRLLSLGDNQITTITQRSFRTNVRLYVLDLHNNSISSLHRNAFKTLPYLRYLILRDNPLVSVNLDFQFNYHLELMDFTNCQLTEIVKGLPLSIRDLRISENNITLVEPRDFRHTRKIRLLLLTQNKIIDIRNDTFHRMAILYELHLSNNSMTRMPVNLPRSLRALFAANNSIEQVEDSDLEYNEKLETLLLNHNNIKQVGTKAFQHLRKLKNLDLGTNAIEVLQPNLFANTRRLELLDISNNPIETADQSCFEGLHNLHILQMSSLAMGRNIRPNIFKNTHNLLFLDLSNSSQLAKNFAESPFLLDYISSVEDLNLMKDGIYTLPADFPNHFPYLKVIKLVDNPWHCDRSIYWLTRWMNNHTIDFFEANHMVCDSPPELRGRTISSLTLAEIPTAAPPREDVTPDINIIDIPFTLGKNYTLLVGEEKNLNRSLWEGLQNGTTILSLKPGDDLEAKVLMKQEDIKEAENYISPVKEPRRKKSSKEYREMLAKQRLEELLSKKRNRGKVTKSETARLEDLENAVLGAAASHQEDIGDEEEEESIVAMLEKENLHIRHKHKKVKKEAWTKQQLEDIEEEDGSGEVIYEV